MLLTVAAVLLASVVNCAVDYRPGAGVISAPIDENWINSGEDDTILHRPSPGESNTPRYLAVSPRFVRPGQVFRVVVTLLSADSPLNVRVSIHRGDSEQVASASERIVPGRTETLPMQIPVNLKFGTYKLRVEGNTNGALGGSGFRNETEVAFSEKFLTILIQTNQLVYNHKQPIHIRIVLLTTEMKPYDDPADIYLVDSRGMIMKRWFSIYPYLGFINVKFQLPSDFPTGWWTVRVKVLSQVEEKKILLERWFGDRFDVNVTLPAYVLGSQEYLEGAVRANRTNFAPVVGNLTLRAIAKPIESSLTINRMQYRRKYPYLEETLLRFTGAYNFRFSMDELRKLVFPTRLEDCELEVRAYVGDRYMNLVIKGYSRTRIFEKSLNLRFLGVTPQIFKPGMPFETHLTVSYQDQVPLEEERLSSSVVRVLAVAHMMGGGRRELERIEDSFQESGVLKIRFDVPKDAERLIIRATYSDDHGRADSELTALSFYSTGRKYMQIYTSTKAGQAGEYAVFHVWANFYMKFFNYLVASKGIVLLAGREKVNGVTKSITTFALPVSPEMAPGCRVVVYHVTSDGEVVVDSLALPVHGINRIPFSVHINDKQDRTGSMVELVPTFTTEGIVGISTVDTDMLPTQGRSHLSTTSVLEKMYEFDEGHHREQRIIWLDREGGPEKVQYYFTPNYGRDSNQTFHFSGLVVFTNMKLPTFPSVCNESSGMSQCVSGQCYRTEKECDGFRDCEDGTDEGYCFSNQVLNDSMMYHLFRTNRQYQFFEATGEDFTWQDILMGDQFVQFAPISPPKRPTLWRITAIAMSKNYGFAIQDEPIYLDGTNPFFITVESPRTAVIGEQIGMRVVLFNYQVFEIKAEVILAQSDDYKFVQVESFGLVKAYGPRTTAGEHQHLLYVKPHTQHVVYVPVVATTVGTITVTIIGRTQIATDTVSIDIEILADGVANVQHTAMLLDMRSEAHTLKFLNLNVSDDPIIPLEDTYRRFMYGSPKAAITIIGDVVGAPLSDTPVVATDLGFSQPVKSGEHVMFDFAYNLWTLQYLRLTNQLNNTIAKNYLEFLNEAYVYQSVFFINGSFSMFKKEPSVWLTAYCARTFWLAQYPGWEHNLFIDPEIISQSIGFLVKHQTQEGSFYEASSHPWDRKMDPKSRSFKQNRSYMYRYRNITLTAHVLITLAKVTDLRGDLRAEASNAKSKARLYLERQLPALTDAYEIAIVTYALMESGSPDAEAGFYKLDQIQKTTEGMIYWGPDDIGAPEVIYQSQRPFIQPRSFGTNDAIAVEATAYALLIYNRNGGIIQDRIVNWLNSMRFSDHGFVSTQDTIVAMEALVDYSFRTHVRDVTSMRLDVHVSANPNNTQHLVVTPDNLAEKRVIEVTEKVWGHVEVLSRGSGMAVLQVDLQFNVDRDFLLSPPAEEAFDLSIDFNYEGRNKSRYHIHSCVRWKLFSEAETSGLAVLEINIPTGYLAHKSYLNAYVQRGGVPQLRRARVLPRAAVFMFTYLDRDWRCVNFTVERWYPVANLTRYLKAKVYEYYMPERYKEVIFEDYELYALNICEVCGSYQCPYCPHFSLASRPVMQWSVLLLCSFILHWILPGRHFNR